MHKFERVHYSELNARQKENFNFHKVSGVLADYGYATLRLSDDWNGADFLAVHIDGRTMLRVQLKARLTFAKKYEKKGLWVCFRHAGLVYLYRHDVLLAKANIDKTKSWKTDGTYSYSAPPSKLKAEPDLYCLGQESKPVS